MKRFETENASLQKQKSRTSVTTIDLEQDDSFSSKHPNFLRNLKLRFAGYKPKIRKALEDFVKELGGQISNDASSYLLTDHFYYASNMSEDCYSISFLSHSIAAEKLQNIQDFRFAVLVENIVDGIDCSCLDIRNVLRAKYYNLDNFDNVKCSWCTENMLSKDMKQEDIFTCSVKQKKTTADVKLETSVERFDIEEKPIIIDLDTSSEE